MIKGKYVFKSNGEIIFEKENIITTNGFLMINRYLANSAMDWAGSIAIGAIGTTSASTNTKLAFETKRIPINLRSYVTSGSVNQIVVKGTINDTSTFSIYEIGIIPLNYVEGSSKDNFIATDFSGLYSASQSLWKTGTSESTATYAPISTKSRYGGYSISASATSVTTNGDLAFNVSNYNTADYVELLYYVPSAGTSPSLTVTLIDSSSSLWTSASVNLPTTSSGFYSASVALSNSKPSSFNNDIARINLTLTGGTGSVQFDALKLMSGAVKPPELKLVSRTSSSAALVEKASNQPIDIEYYLTVT